MLDFGAQIHDLILMGPNAVLKAWLRLLSPRPLLEEHYCILVWLPDTTSSCLAIVLCLFNVPACFKVYALVT
jgi:hypothetical protein